MLEIRIKSLLNDFSSEGLEDIIFKMESLKEEGFYEELFESCKREGLCKNPGYNSRRKKPFKVEQLDNEEIPNTLLFAEAYINLSRPFQHNLIHLSNVYAMYLTIKLIYSIDINGSLTKEETQNVYLNGLDQRITFDLGEFDDMKSISQNEELFLNINDVKWESKESKILFNRLNEIRRRLLYGLMKTAVFNRLFQEEDLFLKYIAACSALKNNRNTINPEDVVQSYKTYFKLLKTDITKYNPDSSNEFNGAVICDECGGYYLLKEGESPDNPQNLRFWDPENEVFEGFSEECECGGKLEYIKSIRDIKLKHPIESPELKVIGISTLMNVLVWCIPLIIALYIITLFKINFSRTSLTVIGVPIFFIMLIILKSLFDRFDLKN